MVSGEWILRMKQYLVVAGEEFEFGGILRRGGPPEVLHCAVKYSTIVEWNGARWHLAAHGPGPKLAGYATQSALRAVGAMGGTVDAVISIGLCGALNPSLGVGDVFAASGVNDEPARLPQSDAPFHSGRLLSLDRVVDRQDERQRLHAEGWDAVEMEAAGVAAACGGRPFYCVRSVSDTAVETFDIDLNAARDRFGRFDRLAIVLQALRRPFSRVPELLRLRKNMQFAVESLGEFIGSCRF